MSLLNDWVKSIKAVFAPQKRRTKKPRKTKTVQRTRKKVIKKNVSSVPKNKAHKKGGSLKKALGQSPLQKTSKKTKATSSKAVPKTAKKGKRVSPQSPTQKSLNTKKPGSTQRKSSVTKSSMARKKAVSKKDAAQKSRPLKGPTPKKTTKPKTSVKPLTVRQKNVLLDGVCVGEITHFFAKIKVAVLKMTHGQLRLGDKICIRGKTNAFSQKVLSLQVESVNVNLARKGQLVGLKVLKPAKVGDKVYKLTVQK